MMTVNEVSKLTGVSVRTLQYYDKIELLKPMNYTEAGYRLYGEEQLEKLQQILLFRELEFPLKDIKEILNRPNFDKEKAVKQQITLLELKKEHIENLIRFAKTISERGEIRMDFSAFDSKKLEDYAKRAKEEWGTTEAYQEFSEKSKGWSKTDEKNVMSDFMKIFREFGNLKEQEASAPEVQDLVKDLQTYITKHFYNCTDEILLGLGKMYAAGGEFTENIDKAGGEGTAVFTCRAIEEYCRK
ncbi:DNA-binding transcriptional regulator, MerR family [Lachnospiraceae bacterium XBB1006]|nr:DNA-binding transcriptional regulator, MerR family [Lachnospiraceae bacterium XBB1006]